ncbi:MAG: hypothetical protein R3D81_04685 [Thalassovita sp.]|jgi:hypothetical protein
MTVIDKIDDIIIWVFTTVIGSLSAGVLWLIRRIFTNQRQIELLKQELEHREQQRGEDRQRADRMERGIERIEGFLMKGDHK